MSTFPATYMTASAQMRRTTGRTIRTQRQDRFQVSGTSSPALSRWGEGTDRGPALAFNAGALGGAEAGVGVGAGRGKGGPAGRAKHFPGFLVRLAFGAVHLIGTPLPPT